MGLPKDEFERRLKAAVMLNDKNLSDLRQPLEDRGMKRMVAERAAQPSYKQKPNDTIAHALSKILKVPEEWFTAEDWRPLIRAPEQAEARQDIRARLDRLDKRLEKLASSVAHLAASDGQQKTPAPPQQPQRRSANGREGSDK